MRKAVFWKIDWFLGLLISVILFAVSGNRLIHRLEGKAYDVGGGVDFGESSAR